MGRRGGPDRRGALGGSDSGGPRSGLDSFRDASRRGGRLHLRAEEDVDPSRGLVGTGSARDHPRPRTRDAPRADAIAAIDRCKRAGIYVVMITGDHKLTAMAVAREMGILGEGERALTGEELGRMSDDELIREVERIRVYARVSPEHKMRIVDAWKKAGHIVAMTGDGVNDAPALKRSDLGVAMGITGTDVAKESADMVLTDDNFASIVAAVEEGRGIYENIRKFVAFLLSANAGEVLIMFIATLAIADPNFLPFFA